MISNMPTWPTKHVVLGEDVLHWPPLVAFDAAAKSYFAYCVDLVVVVVSTCLVEIDVQLVIHSSLDDGDDAVVAVHH